MKIKFALCALILCAGAAALAQQVSVNYNHSQSFSGYHTYAWDRTTRIKFKIRFSPR